VKVLLDHNLAHNLRTGLTELGSHEIVTASYMGWGELKNGDLPREAQQNGFEIFVTGDQSLVHEQQHLTGRRIGIVALSANNWRIIKNHIPRIHAAIDAAVPGSVYTVEICQERDPDHPQRYSSQQHDSLSHKRCSSGGIWKERRVSPERLGYFFTAIFCSIRALSACRSVTILYAR
jgi:hypothetical protein